MRPTIRRQRHAHARRPVARPEPPRPSDRRAARFTNADLAEYLIPVNADIVEAKVILLPETDDQVNPLGIKVVGELANVGTNAAVANAIYHATGVRVRRLPIRLEQLLHAPAI